MTGPTKDKDKAEAKVAEAPERPMSVEQWVNDIKGEKLPWRDEERPPYELLGGFVFKARSEGMLVAKPSEYRERYEAFLKE